MTTASPPVAVADAKKLKEEAQPDQEVREVRAED
jgi:hypothetical protein